MTLTLDCLVCRPTALDQLLASEPGFVASWMALPRKRLAAKEVLLELGAVVNSTWRVERGLVRSYYRGGDGAESNRAFHAENSWLGCGMPPHPSVCPFTIEAITATVVVQLDYDILRQWQMQYPAIRPALDEAMSCLFSGQAKREAALLTLAPIDRYRAFLADHGDLASRIPQHHIASYLGITSVSLSRICARLGLIQPA